jgi:hypothetical protein
VKSTKNIKIVQKEQKGLQMMKVLQKGLKTGVYF